MNVINGDALDVPNTAPAVPQWHDRLVELHVLAEHGDLDAAASAQRWLATDPAAARIWLEVDRACEGLGIGVDPRPS